MPQTTKRELDISICLVKYLIVTRSAIKIAGNKSQFAILKVDTIFKFHKPKAPLSNFVDSFWLYEGRAAEHQTECIRARFDSSSSNKHKNRATATIGMTPRVREVLLALRVVAPPNYQELVFGIKVTVKNGFLPALHEAGIEDVRFHDCRHRAITGIIQAGIPATETMKISGHTQFVTSTLTNRRREKEQNGSRSILGNPARTNRRSWCIRPRLLSLMATLRGC